MNKQNLKTNLVSSLLCIVFIFGAVQANAQDVNSHYVFPSFIKGTAKLKNGSTESAMFNYCILTEELIFDANGRKLAMTNLDKIDTVIINSRKFIPFGKVFYELAVNAPVALFVQYKGDVSSGGQVGYGGTSKLSSTSSLTTLTSNGIVYNINLPAEYSVSIDTRFWVRKNGKLYRIESQRQVEKVFPEKSAEIKTFFKENKISFLKVDDVKKLVAFLN